jgi:hypothetical protein
MITVLNSSTFALEHSAPVLRVQAPNRHAVVLRFGFLEFATDRFRHHDGRDVRWC